MGCYPSFNNIAADSLKLWFGAGAFPVMVQRVANQNGRCTLEFKIGKDPVLFSLSTPRRLAGNVQEQLRRCWQSPLLYQLALRERDISPVPSSCSVHVDEAVALK